MRNLLLAVMLFTTATAFISKKPFRETDSKTAMYFSIDPKECLIDDSVAVRMMAHYRNCRNCPSPPKRKFTPNPEVRKYIEQNNTIVKQEQLMGRYESYDEGRYRKAHQLDARDRKGKVDGFSTIIMKYTVIPKSGFLLPQQRFIYADEFTICPPPDGPGCD